MARTNNLENRRENFIRQHHLQEAHAKPTILTDEADDLAFWSKYQSWTYYPKYLLLEPRKLPPTFARRTAAPPHRACKCGHGTYTVPTVDDVPLVLRCITTEDQHILSPFDIHCGEYSRHFNGYRQRTGPFTVNWCRTLVAEKIDNIADSCRKCTLNQAYDYLMNSDTSSYRKFVRMQANHHAAPYLYEAFSSPIYRGIDCALWPALYHSTTICESLLEGQENRASSKLSFQHKILSAVPDYSLHYYLLQYQFDCWLFKTITGAVNSSKVAGCSPNRSLENKPFWQHQHLYLLDAVRQYGFPSFFVTVSPFLWTFPFPPFMQELRQQHRKDVTDIPALETLHVATFWNK